MKLWTVALAILLLLPVLGGCAAKGKGGDSGLSLDGPKPGLADAARKKVAPPEAESDTLPEEDFDPDFAKFQLTPEELAALTPQEKKALESESGMHFDLEKAETQEVERYFVYFTHKARPTFERWLERSRPYLPYVKTVLAEQGLPEELIVLPFSESGYNNFALSHAGALGMWQFMPATGKRFGLECDWWLDERRDPYKATRAAAAYLKLLNGQFNDWYLALAAYNAGENKIASCLAKSGCDNFFDLAKSPVLLKEETRQYVPKFLAILKIFRNLESLGFQPVNPTDPGATDGQAKLTVPGATDLLALAQAVSMPWAEFNAMNPSFRRQVSPPDRTCTVYLPEAKLQLAQAFLTAPTKTYAGFQQYQTRKGDNWAKLAKRADVPVEVLRAVNRNLAELRLGNPVLVPSRANLDIADFVPPVAKKQVQTALVSATGTKAAKAKSSAYTVRSGDSLYSIARQFETDVATLVAANRLASAKDLRVGQRLSIPEDEDEPVVKTGSVAPVTPDAKGAKGADKPRPAGKTVAVAEKSASKVEPQIESKPGAKIGSTAAVAPAGPSESKGKRAVAQMDVSKSAAKAVSYRVADGDTVWSIARKFNVDPKGLLALNNLDRSAKLKPGDSLKVQMP